MSIPVDPYIPENWSDPFITGNTRMNTPVGYVKFIIDLAKTIGLIDGGLPDQSGHINQLLSTDGLIPAWKNIINFPSANVLSGTEYLLIDQNNHKKLLLNDLGTYIKTGILTSVGAIISPSAISITGSPITTSGTLSFNWIGNSTQQVLGDGSLSNKLTLSTSGTTGPSTYNIITGILNIPNYTAAATNVFVSKETPSGLINGVNTAFSMAFLPIVGTEHIFMNGVLQQEGDDYTISGLTFTFFEAPYANFKIKVSYFK